MRNMVVMKHALANLLRNLAGFGKGEDRRPEIEDESNKPSSIFRHRFSPQIEAMLTASPVWGVEEAKATAAFLNSPAGQFSIFRVKYTHKTTEAKRPERQSYDSQRYRD